MNIWHHKVNVHGFINITLLFVEGDIFPQAIQSLDIEVVKILVNDKIGISSVFSDIVDVNSSSPFDNKVQSLVEGIVQVSPEFSSVLESSVQDNLFNGRTLLIVQKTKIVGILSNLWQNSWGMGKTVSNGNTLQACDGAVIILSFSQNLFSNGWSVLTSITLSENDKRMTWLELQQTEASRWIFEQLFQSVVEVISHTCHVGAVYVLYGLISKSQTCSDRLINKDHIVVFGPWVVVFLNVVWLHVGCNKTIWPAFKQVSKLWRWTWSTIEPENNWIVCDLAFRSILPAIKDKRKNWVTLVNVKISRSDNAIIEIRVNIKIDIGTCCSSIEQRLLGIWFL